VNIETMKRRFYIITIILIVYESVSLGQYLRNPSVESEATGTFAPEGWISCHEWSNPDIYEIQHGLLPVDGNRNAGMLARGSYFIDSSGRDFRKETTGYMLNNLLSPLEKGSCYVFTVYLVHIQRNDFSDEVDSASHPLYFELRGSNDSCNDIMEFSEYEESINFMENVENYELLAKTELIENTEFQQYTLQFTPKEDNYRYLFLRPFWDTINYSYRYNGTILVDNMTLEKMKAVKLPEDTLMYSHFIQLNAPAGYLWNWEPEINLSDYSIQSPIMTDFHDYYVVELINKDICYSKSFRIIPDCDIIYPNEIERSVNVFYKLDEDVQLVASEGERYVWNRDSALSDYNIGNPVVKEYNDVFQVTIFDKYNCSFIEEFNIIANCDILYSMGDIVHEDTLLSVGSSLILEPQYGGISAIWYPEGGIQCPRCISTEVNPLETTNYSVVITDRFDCMHTEWFKVMINLQIPNVITPHVGSGDGKNDVFKIRGLPENSSIKIFDKNGKLIFKADPYNKENWWDGTDIDRQPVKTGTYWYAIITEESDMPITGFIFVKR